MVSRENVLLLGLFAMVVLISSDVRARDLAMDSPVSVIARIAKEQRDASDACIQDRDHPDCFFGFPGMPGGGGIHGGMPGWGLPGGGYIPGMPGGGDKPGVSLGGDKPGGGDTPGGGDKPGGRDMPGGDKPATPTRIAKEQRDASDACIQDRDHPDCFFGFPGMPGGGGIPGGMPGWGLPGGGYIPGMPGGGDKPGGGDTPGGGDKPGGGDTPGGGDKPATPSAQP